MRWFQGGDRTGFDQKNLISSYASEQQKILEYQGLLPLKEPCMYKLNSRAATKSSGTRHKVALLGAAGLLLGSVVATAIAEGFETAYPNPQIQGLNGWEVTPLFTVGETLPSSKVPGGYLPAGVLDGIGAEQLNRNTVRAYVNHELFGGEGYSYTLANGTELKGARVSFFDIDIKRRKIKEGGLAYDAIFDRQFLEVTDPLQINEDGHGIDGFTRLCSGQLVEEGTDNFEDTMYLTHEETDDPGFNPHGGSLWALDTKRRELHAVPAAGRANWENTAALEVPGNRVALLIGDDKAPAPLWLYIGMKQASIYEIKSALPRGLNPPRNNFLNRNGLLVGDLFYFVPDSGITDSSRFYGTGNMMGGSWRKIAVLDETRAGQAGYDAFGYKDGRTLRQEAFAGGAFKFSRPEDVSTNPFLPFQAVMASTGHGSLFGGAEDWGTLYVVNVTFLNLRSLLTIIYDGNDAGGGQVPGPDFGVRSPDNVDWADDGFIYIQEDRTKGMNAFGRTSGREASIWQLNLQHSTIIRIAEMDRSVVVPSGSTDNDPEDLGDWESSGILDVTNLFETPPNVFDLVKTRKRLLIGGVQANGIQDGLMASNHLVQGGQLLFLSRSTFSDHLTR